MWRLALPVLWRDLQAFGYALLRDRSMLSAIFYRFRPGGAPALASSAQHQFGPVAKS